MGKGSIGFLVGALAVTIVLALSARPAGAYVVARVSVASDGTQGNGDTVSQASISADGRYIAFQSSASNLVPGDTNGYYDIFVHDRTTGQTTRVNVASDGTQAADGHSAHPSISADGRYVAYYSVATNLVAGDTNGYCDNFVYDRLTGQTTRVSVANDGTQGDNVSQYAAISADGRYVVFGSLASNLVSGDTNGTWDIFVHDRTTGRTTRVSVASDGTQAISNSYYFSALSADGRYVAFYSEAGNLVAGDTNGIGDVFVHDCLSGQTTRVSVASDGTQANGGYSWTPSLSADGRYVAFYSGASNLVMGDTNAHPDIFVHDRTTGQTTRVSVASDGTEANDNSFIMPSLSADGRYVGFESLASNLVAGDTNGVGDIFVHDRATGRTTRINVASDGTQANGESHEGPCINADGRYVVCESLASNLVPGDTNGYEDVFVALNTLSPSALRLTTTGWHLVAQPHEGDHALRDADPVVMVERSGFGAMPFCDAALANWLQSPLFYYDDSPTGGGYLNTGCDPWDEPGTVRGRGYWVYTLVPDLALVFP